MSATTWLEMALCKSFFSAFTTAIACCTGSKAARRAPFWPWAATAGNFTAITSRAMAAFAPSKALDSSGSRSMTSSRRCAACFSDSTTACQRTSPAIWCTWAGNARTCFRISSVDEDSAWLATISTCSRTMPFAFCTVASSESFIMSGMTSKLSTAVSASPVVSRSRTISAKMATLSCTSDSSVFADTFSASSTCSGSSCIEDSACLRWWTCTMLLISLTFSWICVLSCDSERLLAKTS
mmetsp:Transcript_108179/g.312631  ORF Transcript_108179/g.312631 Transcript_108179/m.312631 type:complete len:239 (+) Transcript_108179:976-1692(+)